MQFLHLNALPENRLKKLNTQNTATKNRMADSTQPKTCCREEYKMSVDPPPLPPGQLFALAKIHTNRTLFANTIMWTFLILLWVIGNGRHFCHSLHICWLLILKNICYN